MPHPRAETKKAREERVGGKKGPTAVKILSMMKPHIKGPFLERKKFSRKRGAGKKTCSGLAGQT